MAKIHKILITGSAGSIGRQICPFLKSQGFYIKGFDIRQSKNVDEFVIGRLENISLLRNAAIGMDAIIHLAAYSDDSDFVKKLVPNNIIGVYNICEVARIEKINRLILASSVQTISGINKTNKIGVEDRFPTNHYGLLKIWAEDLGRMYSNLYDLSVIVVRLGWFIRNKKDFEEMINTPGGKSLFLSHDDAKNFFLCCLLAPKISFITLYALSKQSKKELFDMNPARQKIKFEPKDKFSKKMISNFKY